MPFPAGGGADILARTVAPRLGQVLGQLRLLNGRMTRTETWQDEHNKQDDIQFDRINRELDLLQQRLHSQHQL